MDARSLAACSNSLSLWRTRLVAQRCAISTAALHIELKADSTPVTQADREAEQLCRVLIEARFPDDGIVGEEFGACRVDAARRWIIDPIDGTKSFIRGVPLYGVLIALEQAGRPVLGVVHFPALSETVAAARGSGCYWNGRRARVSEVGTLKDALVLSTDAESVRRGGSWVGMGTVNDLRRDGANVGRLLRPRARRHRSR